MALISFSSFDQRSFHHLLVCFSAPLVELSRASPLSEALAVCSG